MLLGSLVGLERESADKPAGLRTHMLVSGAACLLVGLGQGLIVSYRGQAGGGELRTDPIRVVEAIITGVSFIGAGTIFRQRRADIKGITTAASLLLSAGIGIAVAIRLYLLAFGAAVLTVCVLRLIGIWERRLVSRHDREPHGGSRSSDRRRSSAPSTGSA